MAVAVALGPALGAGLTVLGAAHRVGIGRQQGVDHGLQQTAHQVRGGLSQSLVKGSSRVDNVRSGHRDDSVRVGCRRFLEGPHGDRAATNSSPTTALHHTTGHYPRARLAGSARSWVSTPEALRTWVKKAQVDGGLRPGTTADQAQRIKELEKEVRELRRANAIPKSASACLSRRSVSARPVDLPVHRLPQGGVRGLADLQGAHWRRSQDRPKHLTHARRSRPPSARSLRDEILKAEISKVHKNQLSRCWGPARCM